MPDSSRHSHSHHRHHHHKRERSHHHHHGLESKERLVETEQKGIEESKVNANAGREMEPIEEKKDQEKQTESLLDRIKWESGVQLIRSKVKRILLDYRRNYPDGFRELKTQLDLLDNGYGVELSKIPNSLLQGTLQVCFNLLELPETPRGYFWNEEDYNDCGVFDVLGDCFAENVEEVEASLRPPLKAVADENALDLEEVEEEEEDVAMGPERPPPPVMVGPSIPDGYHKREA